MDRKEIPGSLVYHGTTTVGLVCSDGVVFATDTRVTSGGFIAHRRGRKLLQIDEIPKIQEDVTKKTIIILKVTPLAQKSVDELKSSVEQLYEFATAIGGDIARLGDERVVITPPGVKIWRGLQ